MASDRSEFAGQQTATRASCKRRLQPWKSLSLRTPAASRRRTYQVAPRDTGRHCVGHDHPRTGGSGSAMHLFDHRLYRGWSYRERGGVSVSLDAPTALMRFELHGGYQRSEKHFRDNRGATGSHVSRQRRPAEMEFRDCGRASGENPRPGTWLSSSSARVCLSGDKGKTRYFLVAGATRGVQREVAARCGTRASSRERRRTR